MSEGKPRAQDLRHVDPHDLHQHTNIRSDLDLDEAFLTSIREQGVLVPIVAAEAEDGSLMIEQGHRRAEAARRVGLAEVPVVVLDMATVDAQRLLSQLSENSRRLQTSLSDEAAAHQQLAAFGWSAEDVAATTGESVEAVTAKRNLSRSSLPAEHLNSLSLDQAEMIDQFDDDPDLQGELLELAYAGRTHELARVVQQELDDRAGRKAVAEARQDYRERGYQVFEPTDQQRWVPDTWSRLGSLGIDPADHEQCPGRGVEVRAGWQGDVTVAEFCIDPQAQGHELPDWMTRRQGHGQGGSPGGDDAEQKEKARQERRRVLAGNKAWRAAEPVRQAHVRDWLRTSSPKVDDLRWAVSQMVGGRGMDSQYGRIATRIDQLGFDADAFHTVTVDSGVRGYPGRPTMAAKASATLPRVQAALVAVVLADREAELTEQVWRNPRSDGSAADYLTFLRDHTGYDLGVIERYAIGEEIPDRDLPWAEATASVAATPPAGPGAPAEEAPVATPVPTVDTGDPLAGPGDPLMARDEPAQQPDSPGPTR